MQSKCFRFGPIHALAAAGLTLAGAAVSAQEQFAYPPAGRTAEQQRQDQYECHQWAVEQTHFDPVQYAAQPPQQNAAKPASSQQTAPAGAAVVGGAAKGAAIAKVADEDTGDAARAGAALGLMRQRRAQGAAAAQQAEAQQRAQQQQAQQVKETQAKHESSLRARNTCYKGRGYTLSEG